MKAFERLHLTNSHVCQLPILLTISLFFFVWPPRFLKHPELFEGKASITEEMVPYGQSEAIRSMVNVSEVGHCEPTEEPKV